MTTKVQVNTDMLQEVELEFERKIKMLEERVTKLEVEVKRVQDRAKR